MALQSLSQRSLELTIQSQNITECAPVAEYTLCQHSCVLAFSAGVTLRHGLRACTSVSKMIACSDLDTDPHLAQLPRMCGQGLGIPSATLRGTPLE